MADPPCHVMRESPTGIEGAYCKARDLRVAHKGLPCALSTTRTYARCSLPIGRVASNSVYHETVSDVLSNELATVTFHQSTWKSEMLKI